MADDQDAVVFSADASKLSDDQVKQLQDKFGLKLAVRSRADAVTSALNKLANVAVQDFDRTNPGYERIFDRTAGKENIAQSVINPVDLETHVRNVAERIMKERPAQPPA
jgi:hypothetical protein